MPDKLFNTQFENSDSKFDSNNNGKSSLKMTIRDLNFYYGKVQALKNISMDIEINKVTALIGPSGCGKSTFLRTLNRMNDTIPGTKMRRDYQIG